MGRTRMGRPMTVTFADRHPRLAAWLVHTLARALRKVGAL